MSNRIMGTLEKLRAKTEEAALKWQTTADENSFRIGLGAGIVRVDRLIDNEGDERFSAAIFDRKGREVESVWGWLSQQSADAYFLQNLFEAARRSALDIDSLLTSMDEAIDAGKSSQIIDSKKPDDDIPF
jgi:hypothetical protein